MNRILQIIIFIFMSSQHSVAQDSKIDELSNKLFFNIFIHQPDSSVYDFVKTHFPVFTEPLQKSEWTIYPPSDTFPIPMETTYSLTFKSHPYFKASFTEGRLDLLASEAKGYQARIRGFQLWLLFDSKTAAEKAFKLLSEMFAPLSKSKNIWSAKGRKIAEYCDKEVFNYMDAVQFVLTKDELYENRYKIFFRNGAFTYR